MNGCSKQLFNILPFPWIFFWCFLLFIFSIEHDASEMYFVQLCKNCLDHRLGTARVMQMSCQNRLRKYSNENLKDNENLCKKTKKK